jgi:hypothetical protein
MKKPIPPQGFASWLDYAVATMDARSVHLEHLFAGGDAPSQDEIRAAARDELDELRSFSIVTNKVSSDPDSQPLDSTEREDAVNVQVALHELGQEVSLAVAAAVWRDYSNSLMASWMSGAETVSSAKRTLLVYFSCKRAD